MDSCLASSEELVSECASKLKLKQKTLKMKTSLVSNIGVFTGEKTSFTIYPEEENTGIIFQRIDVPSKPIIPALIENVVSTNRCTVLGKDGFRVYSVEHLLAALKALDIDNVRIEVLGSEIPTFDGSSSVFVDLIKSAGVIEQDIDKKFFSLKSPMHWSSDDIYFVALPSDEFKISYTLSYPNGSSLLRAQYFSSIINEEIFVNEISPCRTFCLYEEIHAMREKGLIKGGDLNNAIIIKKDLILNPEGLKFHNEMARHKVLDLIGDLSLISYHCNLHIIAVKSGHSSNIAFGKKLLNLIKMGSL